MNYKKVSCIVPFYNEGERILKVIGELEKSKKINEIICVDDGSGDESKKKD